MTLRITHIVVLLLVAAALSASELPALIVLPFDNLSGTDTAAATLSPLLFHALEANGWRVIAGDDVDALLERERVRYLDSFGDSVRTKLIESAGATGLFTTSIYRYSDGRNPVVALSARLVRADGTVAWSDIAAVSADDTEALFGFGRRSTLDGIAASAVQRLMRNFPAAGHTAPVVRGPSKPVFNPGPVSFVARGALPRGDGTRICILPFENRSDTSDAARIVIDALSMRLAGGREYDIVEPAVLRDAVLQTRAGSLSTISEDGLQRLARALRTPLFVRGTIYEFADPAGHRGGEPEIDVELSLVDVDRHTVLWSAQHARKGTDYGGLLLLGTVSNSVSLADHVMSEMVREELRAAARGGTAPKGARARPRRSVPAQAALTP